MTLNIADNSLLGTNNSYAYTKKANGFYRIRLSEPSIGFGMDVYRKQFAEVMVYNSKAKERYQKPVPNMPVMPMLADTTLSYTAVDCLGEKVHYIESMIPMDMRKLSWKWQYTITSRPWQTLRISQSYRNRPC